MVTIISQATNDIVVREHQLYHQQEHHKTRCRIVRLPMIASLDRSCCFTPLGISDLAALHLLLSLSLTFMEQAHAFIRSRCNLRPRDFISSERSSWNQPALARI
jgi:hypothetical protein